MAERPVCDSEVRERVTADLGTTFLLEAGAGTGKTRVLVDRYVSCVLDPRPGTGDVRTVAAITFTEKAAGELRQRVREEFERLAVGAADDPARSEVIRGALDALDDAPISTIHGFAGRLLREFPVEAGVDPAFEQLDQLGSELERSRLWDEWLTELAADDPAAGPARTGLSRLLRAGVRLEWLRELALGPRGVFNERYDLDPIAPPAGEPDLRTLLSGLRAPLEQLAEFCTSACSDVSDKGCVAAVDLVEAGRALVERPPGDVDQLAAALFALPVKVTPSAPGGAKGNWDQALGGKDELQTRYREAVAAVTAAREAYAEYVTSLATAVADAFSRWAAAAQLAQGRLDFTDLLGCLRDLLAGDLAARAALQARFSYILVDEFQDTDPLQAEIVFLLCEQRPAAGDWREVVLQPGKLFVVGDPKQSIYRFRRADIGMYDQVKRLVAGQPGGTGALEVIRQNFRTTPSVVNWVNNVFAGVFDDDEEEGRQPGYQWVEPYRLPAEGPRVAVLLGDDFGSAAGAADAARRAEGQALAALLLAMHAEDRDRWTVQDRDGGGDDAEAWRPPRWGDVAILFRATTGLETYEQAFREAGVPYRVDGGKAYFARREVDDALLCLRAVDDPSDGPAVYGALHSSLFGFSDDELFLFWSAGGRFDLFAAQPPGHEAVAEALAVLRGLHERRAAASRTSWPRTSCGSSRLPRCSPLRVPGGRRRSPTSRSWSTGREPSPAPAAWASARSSRGRPRPETPPASRSLRSTTTATWSTCSPSTRPRAWSTPSSSSPEGRSLPAEGAASPSSTATRVAWPSDSRPSCRARRRAIWSRSATRRCGRARSRWRRARPGGCSTWPPPGPATASSSRASAS